MVKLSTSSPHLMGGTNPPITTPWDLWRPFWRVDAGASGTWARPLVWLRGWAEPGKNRSFIEDRFGKRETRCNINQISHLASKSWFFLNQPKGNRFFDGKICPNVIGKEWKNYINSKPSTFFSSVYWLKLYRTEISGWSSFIIPLTTGRCSIPATFIPKCVALQFSLWCVSMPSPIINLMLNQIITQTSYIPILQIKNLNAQQMNVHSMCPPKKPNKNPTNKHPRCFVWVYLWSNPGTHFSPILTIPATRNLGWHPVASTDHRVLLKPSAIAVAAPVQPWPEHGCVCCPVVPRSQGGWWNEWKELMKDVVFQENLDKILIQWIIVIVW